MAPFDYLLILAAVILGLAVAELAIGLNRLLRAGEVRWDWLAPLAALLVFLKIVTQWWTWHAASRLAAGITFEMFLAVLAGATLLFLLAATPLPETGAASVDLRAHYERVRRRFWILFALHSLVSMGVGIWVQMAVLHARFAWSILYLVVLVAVALAFVRNRWVQAAGLAFFTIVYFAQSFGRTLF